MLRFSIPTDARAGPALRRRACISARALVLVLLAAVATPARVLHLDVTGLAEDEVEKLQAARAYARGDLTVDAEHPMLMKLAVLTSLRAADAWNAAPRTPARVPIETAVRLPNAIAGVATTLVLFLLVELLFDRFTAFWAGLLWAVDVNAIAVNRIAKEESFAVLFLLLAAWLYERGKRHGDAEPRRAQRWFYGSGAAFGLMLAAKYVPQYFGLHVLFFRAAAPDPGSNRADKGPFFAAMALAFCAANVAVFVPANWMALSTYIHEGTLTHTGYVFAGRLYMNHLSATPWGIPPWFYGAYLATKLPLLVLCAFAAGVAQLRARPGERGSIFARVFLVFTLLPMSLAATKFVRYMLPVYAVIDLTAAVGIVWALRTLANAGRTRRLAWAATLAGVVLALATVRTPLLAEPYFGLYQNAIGTSVSDGALLFPHDELYDAGLREAVAYVARAASPHAVVMSDAPSAARVYLERDGRPDVPAVGLSNGRLPVAGDEVWVLVQEGRRYFENTSFIDALRQRSAPVCEIDVDGRRAVQVFRPW